MSEPDWLAVARRDIGQRETLAPNDSPWLRRMWAKLSGSWLLGQPWCGGAVASWMQSQGIKYPKDYYRAMSWLDWGIEIDRPEPGAVAVFRRQGGGHVALVVGQDQRGRILCLGGNQGDAVSIAPFDPSRVVGYRWPLEFPGSLNYRGLPVYASAAASSTNEA